METATVPVVWDEKKLQEIRKLKLWIKQMAEDQKRDKAILRKPHHTITEPIGNTGETRCVAYKYQWAVRERAASITQRHIEYNQIRGKPWNMHEYKTK